MWTPKDFEFHITKKKFIQIKDALKKNKYNMDMVLPNGRTLLTYAIIMKQSSLVNTFIDEGADVNLKDDQGEYPLELAIETNTFIVGPLLKKKELDYSIKTKKFPNMLLLAAVNNNTAIISHLIKTKKFDLEYTTKKGYSVMYWAIFHNNIRIVEELLKLKVSIDDRWMIKGNEPSDPKMAELVLNHIKKKRIGVFADLLD